MEKIRENNIDLLKMICCISVIIIHASARYCTMAVNEGANIYNEGIFFSNLMNCITRFAVPCFVMIAGGFELSKKVSYKEFYKKKLKSIVLPTLIFSILYTGYYISKTIALSVKNGTGMPIEDIIQTLLNFVMGRSSYHMWYLYMMLFIYLITPVLNSIKEKIGDINFKKLGIVLLIISIPFAITSTHKFNYDIGFSIYYLGYYILGYAIKSSITKKSNKNFIKYFAIAITILFINSFFRLYIINQGMTDDEYQIPFIGKFSPIDNFSISIVIASILIYKAFIYLDFKIDISNIAKYSLYIYLIHIFVLDIIYIFVFNKPHIPYIEIPIATIIVFFSSLLLSKIYLLIYRKIDNKIHIENKFCNIINRLSSN